MAVTHLPDDVQKRMKALIARTTELRAAAATATEREFRAGTGEIELEWARISACFPKEFREHPEIRALSAVIELMFSSVPS